MSKIVLFLVKSPLLSLASFFAELGSIARFTKAAVVATFLPPYKRSITRRQMDHIGVGSLPLIVLTGLFMGLVLGLQSIVELRNFGATAYMGRPVGTTVIRELGPVLAAMMIAARAGSAIAAELASMVIGEQIDAYIVEGADPIKKLIAPRLLACTIMVPVLTMICDVLGILGGGLVATQIVKVSFAFYWNTVFEVLTPAFIWGGLIKATSFGFVIGIIACYSGMKTSVGSAGVGGATTKAVVLSSITILILDFLLTKIFIVTWW